jgi:ribosome-binding protein aMBF1 (putative translation factor)
LRRKPDASSVRVLNPRILSSKLTLHVRLCASRFVIVPPEKREEFVAILDELIQRLMKIINSNRTKTTVRLRAIEVLAELVRTSYTMVRDVETEELERETQTLEKEAERIETEDNAEETTAKRA